MKMTSRFLKYNEVTELWEDVTPLAARDKVGHALRFANRISIKNKKKSLASPPTLVKDTKPLDWLTSELNKSTSAALQCEPDEEALETLRIVPDYESRTWDSLADHLQNSLTDLHVENGNAPVSRSVFDEANASMTDFLDKLHEDQPSLFGRRGSIEEALVVMAATQTAFDIAMEQSFCEEDGFVQEVLSVLRDPVGDWNQPK
jgi:hypothetical protein